MEKGARYCISKLARRSDKGVGGGRLCTIRPFRKWRKGPDIVLVRLLGDQKRGEGGGEGVGSDFSLWARETGARRRVYVSTEDGHY